MNRYQKERKQLINKMEKYYGCDFKSIRQLIRYE